MMDGKAVFAKGFEVKEPSTLPEIYVDGVHVMYLGTPISKLTFHGVDGIDDEGRESRVPQVRLVIPTGALIEMCRNILSFAEQNSSALSQGYDLQKAHLIQLTAGLNITPAPPFTHPSRQE
ncbi:hypothetical protein IFT43_20415 [Oxalobacteraceae sp. CFBP 13708]|nr:hypothetical protein [Oxalobacteraceae sp. CFBP 13708]